MPVNRHVKSVQPMLKAARIIIGVLFIFSGLIKVNDPVGLSYKMQEFFEVWNLHVLNDYALVFAIVMNAFEVVAGVAVLVGWQMRLFSWLLLVLIVFFTFLTGYALFSGKIKTCGCFGDCIPLTAAQSFAKDLILLVLILFVLLQYQKVKAVVSHKIAIVILAVASIATVSAQSYVLKHLPFVDCLPYKVGNNILKQMQIPEGAVADSMVLTFKYKYNGKLVEFDAANFPADFNDSSYEFVDRFDKLVRKGNAVKPIPDFSLTTVSGTDSTLQVLNTNRYVLVFVKDFNSMEEWKQSFETVRQQCQQQQIPLIMATAATTKAVEYFNAASGLSILTCDATAIKTAARVTPTYFVMQQANIKAKYSYADIAALTKAIKTP
jgi:uncharacterized membrane protein YphA (DoxX/SURF4 family)